MRRSLYTRLIDLTDGSTLVMNLPRKVADIIPTKYVDTFRNPDQEETDDLLTYALQVGYLTEMSEEAELRWFENTVKDMRESSKQAANVAVVATNACNLACSYCFQADTGMRALAQKYLSMSEAEAVVGHLRALADTRGVHHLELFGGEPLLPRTKPVVEYLVREAAKLGLSSRATTNGVYLSDFLEILHPGQLDDLQISVDGDALAHDSRRIPRSGAPTFAQIIENIQTVTARGVHVLIRPNIDRRNIDSLPRLFAHLTEQKLLPHPNVTFQYVNVHSDPLAPDRGVGDYFMSMREIDDHVAKNFPWVISDLGFSATGLMEGQTPLALFLQKVMSEPKLDACGAPSRNIYFSPGEEIYNCHELVGRPEHAVGKVSDGRIIELPIWDSWRSRSVDLLENCRKCDLALAHGGGCGARLSSDALGRWGVCGDFPEDFDNQIIELASMSELPQRWFTDGTCV